jgi:glycogen debranching enzyme
MTKSGHTLAAAVDSTVGEANPNLVPEVHSIHGNVAEAIVIKNGNLFFLSEPDGTVPLAPGHGFGLYYHDCRFLNGYELKICGKKPEVLVRNADRGFMATLGLSNPDVNLNGKPLPKHSVEIRWERIASAEDLALVDTLLLRNLTSDSISFSLEFQFQTAFEDIFAIRGLFQGKQGVRHPPVWENSVLCFRYDGADEIEREIAIDFSPLPDGMLRNLASYQVELAPRGSRQVRVSLNVSTSEPRKRAARRPTGIRLEESLERAGSWQEQATKVHTNSLLLSRVMDRSLSDLRMLRCTLDGGASYFAAGVPWFVALFGRDSIITALQTLAYDISIAEHTIRLLAKYQGKELNPWREEEPGKILHELRVGEMAHLGEIPHTPYYGTVDATPLWLVLVGKHATWSGETRLFDELRPQIDAALNWIEQYGNGDGDGYVKYDCKIEKGLANQGWKDSGDGIINADGSLAEPPIALVEVQGYVYQAKLEMAALFRRAGEEQRASALEEQAERLRERFDRDFWVDDGYYALALQQGNRQAAVLSSNTGHALWSGIAQSERAGKIAERLLSDEMFNGWGVRTLTSTSLRYNPLGYHLGTVWPHDNSLIAAGFKRYGLDHEALRIMSGLIEAAVHFQSYRLPELFGGFAQQDYGIPVSYPVACQPQAWSAGAVPYLLTTVLGLEGDGFESTLRIVRPNLPENVNQVELHGLKVGRGSVDLRFTRSGDHVAAKIQQMKGKMEVILQL